MATENPGQILSSTLQNACEEGTFGKHVADDMVTPCTVKGEPVDFVFRHGADAGEAASLMIPPCTVIMAAGGALADAEEVICAANSKPMSAAGVGVVGNTICGRVARGTSATAEDDEVTIEVYPRSQQKIIA